MMKKHAGYESATKWLVKNFMNVCICYRTLKRLWAFLKIILQRLMTVFMQF